jgi:serine/threonine protein phosphatase PrpC
MPPKDIYVAKYWRDRATEMRALADGMGGARTAQLLNDLADDFDKLAIGWRFVATEVVCNARREERHASTR